jgi:response regulator RpfG family c-di-GMP phosphodiesterase
MARSGPIIIIEDDVDDEQMLKEVLGELEMKNKVICFEDCSPAWDYLKTTTDKPLIIFCDVNLPKQSGLSFKKQIDADSQLRERSIPFVFYTTGIDQKNINEAYTKMTVQGYFQKPANYNEIKKTIKVILDYWKLCKHPNG